MEFFKPDDFKYFANQEYFKGQLYTIEQQASIIANQTLNKLIESSPVVVRSKNFNWVEDSHLESTSSELKARIMFIEEIKHEPCKHEPSAWDVHWKNVLCKHCGVELQAAWTEVK